MTKFYIQAKNQHFGGVRVVKDADKPTKLNVGELSVVFHKGRSVEALDADKAQAFVLHFPQYKLIPADADETIDEQPAGNGKVKVRFTKDYQMSGKDVPEGTEREYAESTAEKLIAEGVAELV